MKPTNPVLPTQPVPMPSTSTLSGRIIKFFHILGPGLITGASDDDPSGIATYSAAGAAFGYLTLWTALFTFPMMAAVQYMSAKIALATGQGLSIVLKQHFSSTLAYVVVITLVVANTINAGVDLGAVAAGMKLIWPQLPLVICCVLTATLLLAFQIWGSYALLARLFKWLTLSLFAYVGAALFAHPEWPKVLYHLFIPHLEFNRDYLAILVAILGTTISPYLFFWQADLEIEEKRAPEQTRQWHKKRISRAELGNAAWDINVGMLFSNSVMFFIILAAAATLHPAGKTQISTAAEAAQALEPLAGSWAKILMALGMIGSGMLAIPILTSSSAYALARMLDWRAGLNEPPRAARGFYAIIVGSTLLGALIGMGGFDPMRALLWTAILNGFLAPPLLLLIMIMANSKTIMGQHRNSPMLNLLGGMATLAMTAAAFGLIWTWF